MNIVVCVKEVFDTEGLVQIDQKADCIKGSLPRVINPLDLLAVEEAVRLKEAHGDVQVTLLCMGPPSAKRALQSCLAIGADRGMILWDIAFAGSDSYATGVILAKAIQSIPHDLIICGQEAIDTKAGFVWAVIAELLDIPVVSRVIRTEVSLSGRKITAYRKLEKGNREIVEAPLPAVVVIETGLIKVRYPTVRAIMVAKRKDIAEYDGKALGLHLNEVGEAGSKARVISLSKPKAKGLFTPDSSLSAAERLRLVMVGGLTERKTEGLQGDIDDMTTKFVQFLDEHKFI
ncbi:electron transfer flavoprotein subunit beta/FixA family protein [Chloroflexota bacterium]